MNLIHKLLLLLVFLSFSGTSWASQATPGTAFKDLESKAISLTLENLLPKIAKPLLLFDLSFDTRNSVKIQHLAAHATVDLLDEIVTDDAKLGDKKEAESTLAIRFGKKGDRISINAIQQENSPNIRFKAVFERCDSSTSCKKQPLEVRVSTAQLEDLFVFKIASLEMNADGLLAADGEISLNILYDVTQPGIERGSDGHVRMKDQPVYLQTRIVYDRKTQQSYATGEVKMINP